MYSRRTVRDTSPDGTAKLIQERIAMAGPNSLANLEASILRDVMFVFFVLDLIPLLHRRFQAIGRLFRRVPHTVVRRTDASLGDNREMPSEDHHYKCNDETSR
jgi:hypothetical protein